MDMSDMFKVFRKEIDWAGRKLVLETGKIARQADGAVLATYGGTTVLATVVFEKKPKPGLDFFPLTVNYQEKAFAAGKIPGGFFKREGRPSEKETLTSRLIDRPIRPLFAEGFRNETLVVITTLAHDMENDPDIVAMVATSAALTISGAPFLGPIGAARVAYLDGKLIINPTLEQTEQSSLDLIVAGTQEGVLMVESEAKELSEDVMLNAVMEGHRAFQPVIDAIIAIAEHAAKDPMPLPEAPPAAKTGTGRLLPLPHPCAAISTSPPAGAGKGFSGDGFWRRRRNSLRTVGQGRRRHTDAAAGAQCRHPWHGHGAGQGAAFLGA